MKAIVTFNNNTLRCISFRNAEANYLVIFAIRLILDPAAGVKLYGKDFMNCLIFKAMLLCQSLVS